MQVAPLIELTARGKTLDARAVLGALAEFPSRATEPDAAASGRTAETKQWD